MENKFRLATIQHTGSKFLVKYLGLCGLKKDYAFSHFDSNISPVFLESTIVTTLQHPHRVAVSWISRGKDLNNLIGAWENFITYCNANKVILFDMNCPEDKRESHLISILKQAEVYETEQDATAKAYANEWQVMGSMPSAYRDDYLKDGTLPKYDWSRFDRAVAWYEMKVKECVY